MDWPAYFPDLNPIEHLWDALGRRFAAVLHHPENTQQLKQMLIDEWALLLQVMLHQLVLSMRRRCEATIAILNNELPDYPSEKVDGSLAEVQARLKYKPLDLAIAPHTEARKVSKTDMEKHRKRRRRRRRKDKRLPFAWGWWRKSDLKNNPDYEGDDEEDEDEEDGVDDQLLCQKRKMVVSFAEIGWGDWIISPKTFDASYCSGVCPHPLKKSIQSSNHATIQGLIHSLGMKKNVPELCCVPNSLAPVSLLYYDQNKNIVLKSFPDMSVQNCSCR
ncbi:bone morphogenetic protein 3 [Trichonephila clavipes]|nr:bone morphogenetic protein 3 [Trichonephila clavipes]